MLPSAIQSVLKQEFQEWELLIVDDGSTDDTKEVVSSFEDSRIKYVYQENQERSAARNNGIRAASGKFICFLDSDDQYLPDHLLSFHLTITSAKNDNGIFYSEISIESNTGVVSQQQLEVNEEQNLQTFLFHASVIPDRICIKKEILDEFQFDPNISISEDTDLWVRIVCKYPALISSNTHSVLYTQHEDNSVNFKRYNAYEARKKTLKQLLKKSEVSNIDRTIARQTLNDCNWGIFKYYYFQNKRFRAWWIMLGSFLEYPRYRTKEKIYLILTSLFAKSNG